MPERQVKQSQTCCSGENILNSSEYQNKMTDREGENVSCGHCQSLV
jgi:hypothetical protein